MIQQVIRLLLRHDEYLTSFTARQNVLDHLSAMICEYAKSYINNPDEYLLVEVLVELTSMIMMVVVTIMQLGIAKKCPPSKLSKEMFKSLIMLFRANDSLLIRCVLAAVDQMIQGYV